MYVGCAAPTSIDSSHSHMTMYDVAVAVEPHTGGTVLIDPTAESYYMDQRVSITATAAEGYVFDRWEGAVTGTAASAEVTVGESTSVVAHFTSTRLAQWTIALYMSGDNDLESYMLQDINELESIDFSDQEITVLVLADRAVGHDTSDGNWTGTRLYRITHDPAGVNGTIVSERLSSVTLGLSDTGDDDELNMGSDSTLSGFLAYSAAAYPANNTALIIWGHGTGYRSASAPSIPEGTGPEDGPSKPALSVRGVRATAIDDGSAGDAILTPELGAVLDGIGLDILAFDLCYGAMLEVAYEVREHADYMIASEGVVANDGWKYDDFLSRFIATDLGVQDFYTQAVASFADRYQHNAAATISTIDLSRVETVNTRLNGLADALYSAATTDAIRDTIRDAIFDRDSVTIADFYEAPGDLNIDVWSLADMIQNTFDYADGEAALLKTAVEDAVVAEWHHTIQTPAPYGIALHYVPLSAGGAAADHNDSYYKDSGVSAPLAFVENSSWVPTHPSGPGLLHRLWYETLP